MNTAHLLGLLLLLPACATGPSSTATPPAPARATSADSAAPLVETWGGMREVLRDGHTEGRVDLARVIGPDTVAVGALAGLAAEITVVGGTTHLAEVVEPESATGVRVRAPTAGEQATLLILANVATWTEHTLSAVSDVAELEAAVRTIATASAIDVTEPFPFRVEGVATALGLHVLDHSCPIADPDGPMPWRFTGTDETMTLVGFYA